jgi:hypothetical protein
MQEIAAECMAYPDIQPDMIECSLTRAIVAGMHSLGHGMRVVTKSDTRIKINVQRHIALYIGEIPVWITSNKNLRVYTSNHHCNLQTC